MVKKIVALSIAVLLMVASICFGMAPKEEMPIIFGEGDGESKVIESSEGLQELLNSVPSMGDYLEYSSILEADPTFKPFTMVENGDSEERTSNQSKRRRHVLEICFTETAVYYKCIGSYTTESYTSQDENGDGNEKSVISYNIELYYSKDLILVKYNDYDIENSVYSADKGRWVKKDGDDSESELVEKTLDTLSKCFGKWMKAETFTEEELMNKFSGMSEEEMAIEYMVYMLCSQVSEAYIEDITSSTDLNTQYLVNLSSFIMSNLETSFDKNGNDYSLKDTDEADAAYLAALGRAEGTYNSDISSAHIDFNLGSSVITVDQNVHISASNNSSVYFDSETTFKNIGNTVVSLKDQKIKTVTEVLGSEFRKLFEEMMEEELNG